MSESEVFYWNLSESEIFYFELLATNQARNAIAARAPNLQTAKDCAERRADVIHSNPGRESEPSREPSYAGLDARTVENANLIFGPMADTTAQGMSKSFVATTSAQISTRYEVPPTRARIVLPPPDERSWRGPGPLPR